MTSLIAGCVIAASAAAAPADRWSLPIASTRLDNGLIVVVSEDHSSPTVGISVIYRVGIRTEPRSRTGFAHLFEHLMFEGTPSAPHGVFDRVTADGGGDNNGSTHPDFTSYIERAPVSALEPLLWLEADRMKTLAFSQKSLNGQRDVVKEEINVNVKNQPYGGFAETDLPLLAFQKWENGHDGYGSFDDLDKASLDDVRGFHRDFYGPNNAVLGIAGDVTPEQGFALAKKYFGAIPSRAAPPRPDVDEPLNTAEKRIVQGDGLARLPALAVGWKMPPRGSRDQAAMIVLGKLLADGDASRLYQALVKGSALAVEIEDFTGSGSPWEYDGPTLYTFVAVYKTDGKADALLAVIDAQIARIEKEGVDPATLQAVKTRMLADWYDHLEPFVDRAESLAILQSVWGDAKVANQVPDLIDGVTSADIQRVAGTYLTHPNRSIIDRRPDFMFASDDPARSDLRAKAKPARTGTVVVGKVETLKDKPANAAPPSPVPAKSSPATVPVDKPESAKPTTQPNPATAPTIPATDKAMPEKTTLDKAIPSQPMPSTAAAATSTPVKSAPTDASSAKLASGDAQQDKQKSKSPTPANQVSMKSDAAQREAAKPAAANPYPAKPDAANVVSASSASTKSDAAKPAAKPGRKPAPANPESRKSGVVKPEPKKSDSKKSDVAPPGSPANDPASGTH